jgi:DNA-binding NtrC family response regulator
MQKLKILVIDDDENVAFVTRQWLEREGYDVEVACSAAEGYFTYLVFKPDIVLTDIAMGEEDGLTLMKRIRGHEPKISTIYMTGSLDHYRSELEQEINDYHATVLEKPFSGRHLLELIAAHCQRNGLSRRRKSVAAWRQEVL